MDCREELRDALPVEVLALEGALDGGADELVEEVGRHAELRHAPAHLRHVVRVQVLLHHDAQLSPPHGRVLLRAAGGDTAGEAAARLAEDGGGGGLGGEGGV